MAVTVIVDVESDGQDKDNVIPSVTVIVVGIQIEGVILEIEGQAEVMIVVGEGQVEVVNCMEDEVIVVGGPELAAVAKHKQALLILELEASHPAKNVGRDVVAVTVAIVSCQSSSHFACTPIYGARDPSPLYLPSLYLNLTYPY